MKRVSEENNETPPSKKGPAVVIPDEDTPSSMLAEMAGNHSLVPLYVQKEALGREISETRVDQLLQNLAGLVPTSHGKTTCMAQFQSVSTDAARPSRGHVHICMLNFLSERGYGALSRNRPCNASQCMACDCCVSALSQASR